MHRSHTSRMGAVLLTILLGAVPGLALAGTPECDVSGGTEFRGCVMPEPLWYLNHDGGGRYFPTRQAATYWAYNTITSTQQAKFSFGMLMSGAPTPTPCQGSCSILGYDPASEQHHADSQSVAWGIKYYDPPSSWAPFQYQADWINSVHFKAICPAGFTTNLEYPFAGNSNKLYTCKPESSNNARGAERVAGIPDAPGCRDKAMCAGSAFGANPVNLATRTKYDVQEDYRNHSPYPIVWTRSYSSTAKRWTFSYDRSIRVTHQPSLSKAYAILARDDGSTLRYKSDNAGTGTTPWTWTLDQGGGKQVVRSRLSDRRDGSGALIGYRLDTLSEEVEFYDLQGKLVAVEGRGGHGLSFDYDGQGRLARIDDDFGR